MGVPPGISWWEGEEVFIKRFTLLFGRLSKVDTAIELLGADSRTRDTIDRYRKMSSNIKANGNGSGSSRPESSS